MIDTSTGRGEVERTLRLTRDRVERTIAAGRVGMFGLAVPTTALAEIVTGGPAGPPLYMACGLAYALVAFALVRRHGAHEVLLHAMVCLDLAAAAGFSLALKASGVMEDPASFVTSMTPAMLLAVQVLNILRSHRSASVVGSLVAAAAHLAVAWILDVREVTGNPARMIGMTTVLCLPGAAGWVWSREARRMLNEHARLQLLRRYLPGAAVARVLKGDPDAALAPGGDLREATLVATDLRGFTTMSEKLPAAEVLSQLNAYHATMHECIEAHGGWLDKFMGDGELAVFGALSAGRGATSDAGAAAAVACARGMLARLQDHNAARAGAGKPPLRMGIGIHTGQVIVGNLGVSARRVEFTCIGDPVNTVSRIEGLTKEAGVDVLVSEACVSRLPSREGLIALPPMAARGKGDPLQLYTLAAPAAAAEKGASSRVIAEAGDQAPVPGGRADRGGT